MKKKRKTTLKVLSFGVVFSLCLRLKSAGQKFSCFRKSLSSTLFGGPLFKGIKENAKGLCEYNVYLKYVYYHSPTTAPRRAITTVISIIVVDL